MRLRSWKSSTSTATVWLNWRWKLVTLLSWKNLPCRIIRLRFFQTHFVSVWQIWFFWTCLRIKSLVYRKASEIWASTASSVSTYIIIVSLRYLAASFTSVRSKSWALTGSSMPSLLSHVLWGVVSKKVAKLLPNCSSCYRAINSANSSPSLTTSLSMTSMWTA